MVQPYVPKVIFLSSLKGRTLKATGLCPPISKGSFLTCHAQKLCLPQISINCEHHSVPACLLHRGLWCKELDLALQNLENTCCPETLS